MPIALDKVFLWGRSLREYVGMFDLSDADLTSSILDCGGGPASFNTELTQLGGSVISCDPIYALSPDDIAQRFEEARPTILDATARNRDNFLWKDIQSIADLEDRRRQAMDAFLQDFPSGSRAQRYIQAELPALPFSGRQFDLALCSHLLFTYTNVLTLEFHLASIRELCRVAGEARIFPLLPSFGTKHSEYVVEVVRVLKQEGYAVAISRVPYEFQKGGNEMLRISRQSARP